MLRILEENCSPETTSEYKKRLLSRYNMTHILTRISLMVRLHRPKKHELPHSKPLCSWVAKHVFKSSFGVYIQNVHPLNAH